MYTHSLCSPTFKIDVYSARYMKGKPKLFCYLKYNDEMTNESSLNVPHRFFFIVLTF